MKNRSIKHCLFAVIGAATLLVSCDKDFNQYGSGIIGDGNFLLSDTLASVVAFNQPAGVVQSNNLPLNQLGISNHPVFGKTKAHFVTQLSMSVLDFEFDLSKFVSLDSVVLTVPYFSTRTVAGGVATYELERITGSDPINLKIYENGYFLTDLDPTTDFTQQQLFFSDQKALFSNAKIGSQLNNDFSKPKENTAFFPDEREFITYKRDKALVPTTTIEARSQPRMSIHLDKTFFLNKIVNAPDGKLLNNNVFKNYFKGLYFEVEDNNSGHMMQLDFTKGDVTIYYREHSGRDSEGNFIKFDHDGDPSTPEIFKDVLKSYVLKMTGNTANLIEQQNTPEYVAAISSPNTVTGDQKLFLKGGTEGSVALIDLFPGPDLYGADGKTGEPNGISDELDRIKSSNWLINEASLTFYVDQSVMGTPTEPKWVYLYDAKNKRPILDYALDRSTAGSSMSAKRIYDGSLQVEPGENGRAKYKVRITNHINNILTKDSTNVRLGLSISEDITNSTNAKLKTAQPLIDRIPTASVISPKGTVLWGNTADGNAVKLEIFYTKPN